jgi:GTP cyclohydrolase I
MVVFANLPLKDSEGEVVEMAESGSSDQEAINGKLKRKTEADGEVSKKKRRRSKDRSAKANGSKSASKRRHSVSKPARDPRDGAPIVDSHGKDSDSAIRSPSPVIDFDGLSKPSKCPFGREWGTAINSAKALVLVNAKKNLQSKQRQDSRRWLVQSEQS